MVFYPPHLASPPPSRLPPDSRAVLSADSCAALLSRPLRPYSTPRTPTPRLRPTNHQPGHHLCFWPQDMSEVQLRHMSRRR